MSDINNDYDAVHVRFRNSAGHTATASVLSAASGAADRRRWAFLDLGRNPRSFAEAERAGNEFLSGQAS